LPSALYRIEGNRLALKTTRNFAKGDTPVDRNRRDLLAALEKAKKEREAEEQRREAARLAAQANPAPPLLRQAPAATQSNNPHCQFAQWSGVIDNVGDLFLCDEARAIEYLAGGVQLRFRAARISFAGGKYVATMSSASSDVKRSNERMQRNFNWNDWMNVTQNIAPTTVVCRFSGPAIRSGEERIVSAKLENYTSKNVVLNCS
jgi:hypothetical protein